VQAAVVGESAAALARIFWVLAADGSEASADALLPHFHCALTVGTGLEQLRTHATRGIDSLKTRWLEVWVQTPVTDDPGGDGLLQRGDGVTGDSSVAATSSRFPII
jgi:hypothetical protein